jgi:hypothetical protein
MPKIICNFPENGHEQDIYHILSVAIDKAIEFDLLDNSFEGKLLALMALPPVVIHIGNVKSDSNAIKKIRTWLQLAHCPDTTPPELHTDKQNFLNAKLSDLPLADKEEWKRQIRNIIDGYREAPLVPLAHQASAQLKSIRPDASKEDLDFINQQLVSYFYEVASFLPDTSMHKVHFYDAAIQICNQYIEQPQYNLWKLNLICLLERRAALHESQHNYQAAFILFELQLVYLNTLYGKDCFKQAQIHGFMAKNLLATQQYAGALTFIDFAIAKTKQWYGNAHPKLTALLDLHNQAAVEAANAASSVTDDISSSSVRKRPR